MEAFTQRRNAAVIRSRSGRIYRLAAVSPGVGLPSVYWAYLGPSFQQATWRQRLAAEDVQAAFAAGRAVEGFTQAEAEAMTAATRPPQPAPDRVPARRGKKPGRGGAAPVVPKSPAQALHLDLVREGFRTQSERYALATAALGRPVASFTALTPGERNAVRDAAFTAYA